MRSEWVWVGMLWAGVLGCRDDAPATPGAPAPPPPQVQPQDDTAGGTTAPADTSAPKDTGPADDTGTGAGSVERGFIAGFGPVLRGGGQHALEVVPVDAAKTLEATLATGQTRLAVAANDGTPSASCPNREATPLYEGSNGAGHHWCAMREIVAAADGTGLEIVAILGERHTDPEPRWLDTSDGYHLLADCGDPRPAGCHETWDRVTHDRFLDAWIAGGEELSRLSTLPGNSALKGFTIDDFFMYICGPNMDGLVKGEGCFTTAEVARITHAAKTCEGCNPDFQFWVAAAAVLGAPRTLPGTHILGQHNETLATAAGVARDFPVMDGDRVSVEFSFSLDEVPDEFRLSFLFSDGYEQQDAAYSGLLFSVVQIVSGEGAETQQIFETDVSGNEWVQFFDQDLSAHLQPGETTVRIGLQAADEGLYGAPANRLRKMNAKLMAVWGLRMQANGEAFTDHTVSYACPGGCVAPGETGYRGYFAGPSTEDSAAASDGILMRMYAPTTLFSVDFYTYLIARMQEAVGDRGLFPIMVGQVPHSSGYTIDAATRAEELDLLTRLTDGVYLWAYSLPVYGLADQTGIFAEPKPTPTVVGEDGEFSNDWDGAARWPASEPCLSSWVQQWSLRHTGAVGQNACVTVKLQAALDREEESSAVPEYSFRMVVGQPGDPSAFVNTEEGGSVWSDGHLVWTQQVAFDATQPITVRLENTVACGNRLTLSRFRVVHTEGDCTSGLFPEGTHFDTISYEATLEDPDVVSLYCALGTAMQDLSGQEPWSRGGGDVCGG